MKRTTPAQLAQYDALRLKIPQERLAQIHRRLVAGEEWKDLADEFHCSTYGLKSCLQRAGYNLNIRELREAQHAKTRSIEVPRYRDARANSAALQFLSRPLICSQ